MELKFRQRYLSIEKFPDITVPPLTIIVGINGSGKSHLLQAIQNGNISNDIEPVDNIKNSIRNSKINLLVNYKSTSKFSSPYDSNNQNQDPDRDDGPMAVADYKAFRDSNLSVFYKEILSIIGGESSGEFINEDIWFSDPSALLDKIRLEPDAELQIRDIFVRAEQSLHTPDTRSPSRMPVAPPPRGITQAQEFARRLAIPMLHLSPDLYGRLRQTQVSAEQFAVDLSEIFGRYRDELIRNRLRRMESEAGGDRNAESEKEFVGLFGPAPWTLISEALQCASLPYEIVRPPMDGFDKFSVAFTKSSKGESVSFSQLSSGERVLFELIISSFEFQKTNGYVKIRRPKLLLLDEMDASLHPEMVHRWLGVIKGSLVEEQGIHCILTTHSPTTVALAPEEALYEMKDGRSGLTKITKQRALNKLTFGVPTLSVDFSGRRQVFVESSTDAEIYELVYSLIKSRIDCERELNFLSTGMRIKGIGDVATGCAVVQKIVGQMVEVGNRSVFGIVDWDGKNQSDGRIKVLAENRRYTIENLFLDPLLVCLRLMQIRKPPQSVKDIGGFVAAASLSPENIQRLVDAIQNNVVKDLDGEKIEVPYIGKSPMKVFVEYLNMNDLEDILKVKFPALKQGAQEGKGAVVKLVVEHVLSEYPEFCPIEMKELFEDIASCEVD